MKKLVCGAFAAALLSTVAAPAFAADLPSTKSAPVFAPVDDSFDPFMIRVSALGVLPNASGSTLLGGNLYGARLQDNVVPEVDFTYFLTKHWAVNVIAGIAHTRLTNTNAAGVYNDWANTTLLPPTATLQYHFALGQFDPYLGVGANYTWFLETKSPFGATLGNSNLVNLHPAAGLALNAGADYYLTKHWVLNLDAKYLILNTDGNLAIPGGLNQVHVNANTWLIGGGIGYRFGGSSAAPVVAKY